MSLGEVAQVTSAFIIVLGALNWMVENYSGMADCLSSINRVGSLLLALDDLEQR
jgi:putative ATP-binding cassette transporter